MNENKELLKLCNKVWYDDFAIRDWDIWYWIVDWEFEELEDIRTIIYTQYFMDKLREAMIKKWYQETWYEFHMMQLVTRHLDNPVEYLCNLLEDE